MSGNHPKQGEVWLVDFSPVVGREQGGHRPALVLSRDDHNRNSAVITVAPLTSSMTMKDNPASVFLSSASSGAKVDSLILVFQLRTIDKSRCVRRLFELDEEHQDKVWNTLWLHFERPIK